MYIITRSPCFIHRREEIGRFYVNKNLTLYIYNSELRICDFENPVIRYTPAEVWRYLEEINFIERSDLL